MLEKLNIAEALRYMGSRGHDVSALMPLVEECEKELLEAIKPAYIYKYFDIAVTENGAEIKGTNLLLSGKDIADHLEGCSGCVLLCATASAGADRLIRKFEAYDMTKAFVTDCLASSAVESVCNEVMTEIRDKLPGKYLTWRFSPGYGDLPLSTSHGIIDVLNAGKRIGLSCTESDMLVPTKSVTAVIGVSDSEIPRKRRGCEACNMYEKCGFRKGGERCEF
ncbi:MAG: methionine synthase [Ruminococcus sp.]|nr:methionine synthase [Ruminococcus sp.]